MNEKRAKIWLVLICLAYTLIFSIYVHQRHSRMKSASFDLGIFNQGLYLMSQGEEPFISVRGVYVQEDHFQPILHLVAPIYHLWTSPMVLLMFQTMMLASGAIPAYLIARRFEISERYSLILAAAYLCQPALQFLNAFDFHTVSLMTTALMWTIWSLECGPAWAYALSLTATLMCTEAAGFTVLLLSFNAYRLRGLRWAGATAAMAVVGVLVAKHNSAYFAQGGASPYAALYSQYGTTEAEVVLYLLSHPFQVAQDLLIPLNLFFIFVLLSGMALLPVLSPSRLFPTIANMLGNLLSWRHAQHRIEFHYGAALAPFLFWAAVAGWAWLEKKKGYRPRPLAMFVVLSMFVCTYLGPLGPRHSTKFLFDAPVDLTAISKIDDNDVVSAGNFSGPHVSMRKWLFLFPNPFIQAAWGNNVESLVQQSAGEYPPVLRGAFRRGLEHTQVDWILYSQERVRFPVRREDEVVCREEVGRSAVFESVEAGPNLFLHRRRQPRDSASGEEGSLAWEDVRPRLSADGRRVTFQVNRNSTLRSPPAAFGRLGTGWSDVVVVDRDLGAVERISSDRGHCRSPVLADDGRLLAYSSLGPDAVPCIFLRDLEKKTEKLLRPEMVKSGRGGCFAPDFSADGRYLSCMTYRKADNLKRWRFSPSPGVMLLDSANEFETPFRGQWSTVHSPVALSPDGTRRAWEMRGDHSYLAVTEGTEPPRVVAEHGFSPTLSQKACVFVAPDDRKIYQLMLHDFESGQTVALTRGNDDSLEPRISPDGRWLAFSSYASDLVSQDTNEECDVFLFDLDQKSLIRVTPNSSNGPCYNPDLSADGSTVVFATLATRLEKKTRPAGQVYLWERSSGKLEAMPFISR